MVSFNSFLLIFHCRITQYLEPLAIAANITQASFFWMDEVLLTFGSLFMQIALCIRKSFIYHYAPQIEKLPKNSAKLHHYA